ncbi:bacteriohemerythrin [Dendrosporobacter sp. 1207_IL3150]|uniref:bacteriohemerythrin n=1 Tax=Dendrosporobacter sp. 1207_IL3150 TaxID=3084054 RepID=UPI002FD96EFF
MAMVAWKDEYSIGVADIDEQHKELFEIVNRTQELLKNELIVDKYDGIVAIINELKEYTIFHFKAEEEYMFKNGYKKFFSHKVLHQDFIEKIEKIDFAQLDNDQNKYLEGILVFVCEWLLDHILKEDKLINA